MVKLCTDRLVFILLCIPEAQQGYHTLKCGSMVEQLLVFWVKLQKNAASNNYNSKKERTKERKKGKED
jgi:hypothetical protein